MYTHGDSVTSEFKAFVISKLECKGAADTMFFKLSFPGPQSETRARVRILIPERLDFVVSKKFEQGGTDINLRHQKLIASRACPIHIPL
jgi:hypothetical protein